MLNYEFPPLGGGAATATYNLLKEFSKNDDITVDLVTSSVDEFREEKFSENITIFYLDIGKKGNIHDQTNKDLLVYSWKTWNFSRELKKKNKYDLIHAFFGIPCGFIAMLLKLPFVVSLRGSDVPFYSEKYKWLDIFIFRWLSSVIWRKAIDIIANSEGLKQLALKTKSNQKIGVIYNGVDTELFYPTEKKDDEFVVISTSRLISRKGMQYLLRGFVDFAKNKNNVRLMIIGEGSLRQELENIVKSNMLKKKTKFLGAIERKSMPDLYRYADVFVLPSLNEGMSNSLLEAMASGLAIVATNTGGTKELLDESNGIIIKKKSHDDVSNVLEELFLDRAALRRMKLASRKKAQNLSWKDMSRQYHEVYKKITEPAL